MPNTDAEPEDRPLCELPRFTTDAGFMSGWRSQFKDLFRYDEDGRITSYNPDWTNGHPEATTMVDLMATWLGVWCHDKVPLGFFDRILVLLPAGSSTKPLWSQWVDLGSALVESSAEPRETWAAMYHILRNMRPRDRPFMLSHLF